MINLEAEIFPNPQKTGAAPTRTQKSQSHSGKSKQYYNQWKKY